MVGMTLKLYASLGTYLPGEAKKNCLETSVRDGTTIEEVLDAYGVPREACHLVLLNGVFQKPDTRSTTVLKDGDAVAVWPPVAGG